jgi:prepilin-type processing-associated H-X9-DG protein
MTSIGLIHPYRHSDYDNNADDASLLDSDVNLAFLDGHHSDLFENLFQILPVGDSEYRSPGTG